MRDCGMTGIVDYNAGNIRSVEHALFALGAPFILSGNSAELARSDRLIFPGVGDTAYAMEQLRRLKLDAFIKEWAAGGKPLMGICLGAQIVFDFSEEGDVECLGLLRGTIRHLSHLTDDKSLKIPHMGWNNISYRNGGTHLFDGVKENTDFYFVHSYAICPEDLSIVRGAASYGGIDVPAAAEKGAISVFQFHPEKSGEAGLAILRNFVRDDLIKASGGGCA